MTYEDAIGVLAKEKITTSGMSREQVISLASMVQETDAEADQLMERVGFVGLLQRIVATADSQTVASAEEKVKMIRKLAADQLDRNLPGHAPH